MLLDGKSDFVKVVNLHINSEIYYFFNQNYNSTLGI